MPDSSLWSTPLSTPRLAPDDVHVWRVRLDVDADEVDALRSVLASDEHDRAACFRFDRDRRAFIAARGTLRLVLSRYLDRQPDALRFAYGPYGKPELASESDLRFNVTHAGELALIAVARGRQLGVDLEPIRDLPDADAIVDRFFSEREVAVYRSLAPEARPEAFFTCWTRKEAFIKAVGDGLAYPLADFDVTVRPEEPARLLRVRGASGAPSWHLEALPVDPGTAATLAVEGAPVQVSCWDAASLLDAHASSMLVSS